MRLKLCLKMCLNMHLKMRIKLRLKMRLKNYVRNKKKGTSFLKISDPVKRDLIVKEYIEIKKNIRDNVFSERTREQELQTDLSKFYKPITETQKATAREITEGLRPIREGIKNLQQAITFPSTQPLGEASGEEESQAIGEIAGKYLNIPITDKVYGIYKKEGLYYIGNKQATIADNNIIIGDKKFKGTPGLWELLMSKNPDDNIYTFKDYETYKRLMLKTNALHRDNYPKSTYPKGSRSEKWLRLLSPIWHSRRKYEGEGVVVIPGDPNALLERLDLLLEGKKAGHTWIENELVSICDELKRQGVLDSSSYKKINLEY